MKASIDGGDFELAPVGLTGIRPFLLVDIGKQQTNFGMKRQIIVGFELTNELMNDGRPFTIFEFMSLSLSAKANLCKCIEGMYGKTMPDDAKNDFDFQNFLGTPAMGTIIHKAKQDGSGDRAVINSYSPVPKDSTVKPLVNSTVFFDLDSPDDAVYGVIPDWIKKRINGYTPNSGAGADFTNNDDPF